LAWGQASLRCRNSQGWPLSFAEMILSDRRSSFTLIQTNKQTILILAERYLFVVLLRVLKLGGPSPPTGVGPKIDFATGATVVSAECGNSKGPYLWQNA
jgi:hypothetical protein